MRITIAAVGRLKTGPERSLAEHYRARAEAIGRSQAIAPIEILERPESRARTADLRKDEEAERLLAALADAEPKARGGASRLVVLDERGRAFDSVAFAELIRRWRDNGTRQLSFAIGGPDGLAKAVCAQGDMLLSLSAMTLPHALARIVLLEQLYRAMTILAGHPYHRA